MKRPHSPFCLPLHLLNPVRISNNATNVVLSKATIAFLKSGNFPEGDQTTVVAPPALPDGAGPEKKRLVVRLCFVAAVATGLAVAVGLAVKSGDRTVIRKL